MTLSQRRRDQLLLAGLTILLAIWDLWAVLRDGRLSGSDTFVGYTLELERSIREGGLGEWLTHLGPKGPVAPLLALPLLLLVGQAPLAMRLLSVAAHVTLTLQSHDLGRRLGGSEAAGQLAAVVCGTTPLIFGFCRLDHHDVLVAVAVAAVLQLALRVTLERLAPALLFGALLGLGVLVKLSAALYLVWPALWLAARRARGWRSLARLGGAAGVALGLAATWAIPNRAEIWGNVLRTRQDAAQPLLEKLGYYLALPGVAPLLVVAVASTALLWRSAGARSAERGARGAARWDLALLLTALPMTVVLLTTPYWSRYLLPILPPLAVIAGCGLAEVGRRLRPSLRALAGWIVAAALIVLFGSLSLRGLDAPSLRRELYAGMIRPDARRYDAYARAARALLDHGPEVLLAYDSLEAIAQTEDLEAVWRRRGVRLRAIELDDARRRIGRGEAVSVLLVRRYPDQPLLSSMSERWPPVPPGEDPALGRMDQPVRWLASSRQRRRVATARDPDGMEHSAYRVER
jgi:4-amino-4-deoxy-L-arabinose transferase-like glycosyltransferase